ncbi:P-loop containing nucleoside triphosphate hydrolase protein [Xylariaceae sp. FL0255]|nr:P-loop containing nucleoside triphosphate hydrolase protein [Xylariaceae sp. FL0255]
MSSSAFIPRPIFEVSSSLVRSYFLGHHNAALRSMREMIQNVNLVLECRDSRVPLTSANPLLESALAGRDRIIVYTKSDLCSDIKSKRWKEKRLRLMTEWNSTTPQGFLALRAAAAAEAEAEEEGDVDTAVVTGLEGKEIDTEVESGTETAAPETTSSSEPPLQIINTETRGPAGGRTQVIYTSKDKPSSTRALLSAIKKLAIDHADNSIMGLRALVVGMPNVGKSTLLNELRYAGMSIPHSGNKIHKAAKTGGNPGVTRKFSTPVRIIAKSPSLSSPSTWGSRSASASTDTNALSQAEFDPSQPDVGEGVFLVDTPGVFIPYAPSVEAMLKLALVGCVADSIIPAEIIADYLLFLLNLRDPKLYRDLSPPTNDVGEFLKNTAIHTGKLKKGGTAAREIAANWVVQRYREGRFGGFGLDEISEEALVRHARKLVEEGEKEAPMSLSQARKREKAARAAKHAAKRAAAKDSGASSAASF